MTATVRTRAFCLLATPSAVFFKKEKRNAVFYILIFTTHHFLYTINLIFRKKMRKFAI